MNNLGFNGMYNQALLFGFVHWVLSAQWLFNRDQMASFHGGS